MSFLTLSLIWDNTLEHNVYFHEYFILKTIEPEKQYKHIHFGVKIFMYFFTPKILYTQFWKSMLFLKWRMQQLVQD